MGNGVPPKLPATEESWEKSQKIIDGLENAMLEQRKKELSENKLTAAITRANNHGFNGSNTPLVDEAEKLLSLVTHKFSEVKVNEYKAQWEREEADKDPEGELFARLKAEEEEEEEKMKRRKRPEKKFNIKPTNRAECMLIVKGLPKDINESLLREHFDSYEKTKGEELHCGNFIRINICYDTKSLCTGTAYVEYPDEKEKNRALDLNNTTLNLRENNDPDGDIVGKCKLTVKEPDTIPTPPSSNTVARCVTFAIDGCLRTVRAHFLPAFGDLFKKPISEQNKKDSTAILEYIESVKKVEVRE